MRDYNHKALYPYTKVLSSSQFLCYLRSPQDFELKYKIGMPEAQGPALLLGKGFAEARANPEFDLRAYASEQKLPRAAVERLVAALPLLARPEQCEREMIAPVGRGWELRATLDGYNPGRYEIIEDKTGSVVWTQERVNFDNQITFQSFVHWKLIGVQPARTILNWVPTVKADHMVYRFKTTRSIAKLKQFGELVDTVIENIEAGNFSRPIL